MEIGVKFAEAIQGIGLFEREHRLGMPDALELFQGGAAHALGGGVRGDQIGMRGFEFLKLGEQLIVIVVGYFWPGIAIVEAVVPVNFLAQGRDSLL